MTFHSGNQMVDPQLIFEKARLQSGMHVADFGCGQTGHIIFPCSLVLGEMGVMYAVDILKDVLESIKKRAAIDGLVNIHTIWSDLERTGGTKIPEKSLDVIFLVNTLVQTKDRSVVLNEAKRLLKDKARIVIVDWVKKGLAFGPQDNHFIDFGEIKNWARENNFAIQEEFDSGPYHRGVVLYRHE